MFLSDEEVRPGCNLLRERIDSLPEGELDRRQAAAEKALLNAGITFHVYGDGRAAERIWPFDVVPRVIELDQWAQIEAGLKQRIRAVNCFIDDVYHDQKIFKDQAIPREVLESAAGYLEPCKGLDPPKGIWCHITGSDLVRDGDGTVYVLEDNLRVPSGVSYVLSNRQMMKRTFPEVFARSGVLPVDDYPTRLLDMMNHVAPATYGNPVAAILTPGMYNSAYFEHSYLAQQTGVALVEGRDLVVHEGYVCMRTTRGLQRIDVLYRRVNDDYLDPEVFNSDSMLSVPGLMDVYRQGRISLVNAPGTGVADDKVVYAFVPEMIRYYLDEDQILPNVETYLCFRDADRQHVLENLEKLVVKPANESGGYGLLVGPRSTQEERDTFARLIQDDPRNYVAQPTLSLSRAPVITDGHFEGRHVDLRPFILYGEDIYVVPGGLTRVALKKDSLVVNSSQGGGSKDTWVVSALQHASMSQGMGA